MSFRFINDKAMYASKYVECYTGNYYTDCDTFSEAKDCLSLSCIRIDNGWRLSEIDKIPDGTNCVLVEFSAEDNYTVHEFRIMPVQKRYLKKFLTNMSTS